MRSTASAICFSFFNMSETGLNGELVSDKSIRPVCLIHPVVQGVDERQTPCPVSPRHLL